MSDPRAIPREGLAVRVFFYLAIAFTVLSVVLYSNIMTGCMFASLSQQRC